MRYLAGMAVSALVAVESWIGVYSYQLIAMWA
jgi:hypothetical protein